MTFLILSKIKFVKSVQLDPVKWLIVKLLWEFRIPELNFFCIFVSRRHRTTKYPIELLRNTTQIPPRSKTVATCYPSATSLLTAPVRFPYWSDEDDDQSKLKVRQRSVSPLLIAASFSCRSNHSPSILCLKPATKGRNNKGAAEAAPSPPQTTATATRKPSSSSFFLPIGATKRS